MKYRIEFTFPKDPELAAALIIMGNENLSEVITRWAREWLGPQLPHVTVRVNDEKTEAEIYASATALPIGDNGHIPAYLKVGTATITVQSATD